MVWSAPVPGEVRVGVHADDVFSGAQLTYMAAFNSKMGALGQETWLSNPNSNSSSSRGKIFVAPGSPHPRDVIRLPLGQE